MWLKSKLGNHVPYTDYNLKVLLLENELGKYSPLNYFLGKYFFGDGGNQNYLIFQPMSRYLKFVTNSQKKRL